LYLHLLLSLAKPEKTFHCTYQRLHTKDDENEENYLGKSTMYLGI